MVEKRLCLLMILDGWGINDSADANAVALAQTPCLDNLLKEYPNTELLCSGEAVGLPTGIMGNSEVGHLNIGAGRIVYQDLLRIDMAIKDGSFFENKVFDSVMSKVKANDSALHLMGLVSDGGVHSQMTHLFALLDMAGKKGIARVYVHVILDGRDTPPESGVDYIEKLQKYINANNIGTIATVCGRFYAMDRDTRWERVEQAYELYTLGKGIRENDPVEAVKNAYKKGETDEFVHPVVICDDDVDPEGTVQDKDGIIFFNFRADRAREITRALTDPDFDSFNREKFSTLCEFVCMTLYEDSFSLPIAFPPIYMEKILGHIISGNGLKQLRIAETEKYAHVTYFFNGGEEAPHTLEDRSLIPSPRDISTYDQKPEMSASEVAEKVVAEIESCKYNLIVLNFANMDMVGHTGILEAAIKACETVDSCVKKVVDAVLAQNGCTMITADHGNSEQMKDENGNPHTAHTLNPVRFVLVDDERKTVELKKGRLGDIAPTVLHVMGIEKPEQMTGESLI